MSQMSREYQRRYYHEHKEKISAQRKKRREADPSYNEKQRERYHKNREHILTLIKERKKKNPNHYKEYAHRRYLEHKAYYEIMGWEAWQKKKALFQADAGAYAEYRRKKRDRHLSKTGGKPLLSMRIPDWAVMGQNVLDTRSKFLRENLSKDELTAIENYRSENAKRAT